MEIIKDSYVARESPVGDFNNINMAVTDQSNMLPVPGFQHCHE